jgi:2-polyprenyl-3-methyl-5-hydroxy-6-metoxy-1,4-benzoquinol methylase
VSEVKPGGYYSNSRPDLVADLPRPLGSVLDVGCGEGAVGRLLRSEGAERLTGIEIDPEAARVAREFYDEVAEGAVEDVLPTLSGPFDAILCYDVLEHLVDPSAVLARLRTLAAPGGHLHVSVPNARHFSLVKDLVLRGTFGYTDWGHRDNTHLRWFTRRDIVAAVEAAGWHVVATSHPPLGRSQGLDRITRGRSSEFLVAQVYVLARA